jgi:thiamine biosynthesis protein ThiS
VIHVDDKHIPWREGMTVTALIEALGASYEYPAVRINNKIISRPQFDHTPVPDEAKVFLIPLVAGG